jgi:hypothetical protein
MITEIDLSNLIAAIIALISVIIAILKNRETTTTKAAYTSQSIESATPAIVATLPERSWKMSESTLRYCTFDATPENRELIIEQIKDAEASQLTHYQVHFNGGYYIIDYGLLMGGAGNPSGK